MHYFDHNATTPVLPAVREAMLPYFAEDWGNPSNSYRFGAQLKSNVIAAMKPGTAASRQCVRFSLGLNSSPATITEALKVIPPRVAALSS